MKIFLPITISVVLYLTLVKIDISDKTNYKSSRLELDLFTQNRQNIYNYNMNK